MKTLKNFLNESIDSDIKYTIIKDDTIKVDGHTLYRIKAVNNFDDVKAGDLGGYIEHEGNLMNSVHKGNCWIYDDAMVFGKARVLNNAKVSDNAQVYDKAKILNRAKVFENAKVYDYAKVYDNAKVRRNAQVFGHAEVYNNANIIGDAKVYEYAKVYNNAWVAQGGDVSGTVKIYCDAEVDYTVSGNKKISNNE